jgi:hypothetical protein
MKALFVIALALVSTSAFARPNTANLTCRDASGLVAQSGAIVLSTGSAALYDRFVANSSYCGAGEAAVAAYVTTLDNDSCKIGFACQQAEPGQALAKKYPSKILACKEGRRSRTYTYDGDKEIAHATVCKNGKYVRVDGYRDPAPVYRACKEGATFTESERGEGTKTWQCQGGKYRIIYQSR